MIAWVHSSLPRGNAPDGYVIARVQVAPGLFVDAELNPYTDYKFKAFALFVTEPGNEECLESEAKAVFWFDQPKGQLEQCFNAIETMYGGLASVARLVLQPLSHCDYCHPRPRG